MEKYIIRNNMRDILDKLSKSEIELYSNKIVDIILKSDVYKNANSILLYKNILFEPNLEPVIEDALEKGKKVYLPRVEGQIFVSVPYEKATELVIGKYNIPQPVGISLDDPIDLAFIPLTAFDKNMNRVGKGAGFYDRYLFNREIIKLGVAYGLQEVEEIYSEPFDIPLDNIITEKGLLKCE